MASGVWLRQGLRELLDWLYPRDCPGCGEPIPADRPGLICAGCEAAFAGVEGTLCSICGEPVPKATISLEGRPVCPRCTGGRAFASARSAGRYAPGPVAEIILAFKHSGWSELAVPLGRWMAAEARRSWDGDPADLVVPVPLHPLRRLHRGQDQARLLARATGRALGLPVQRLLRRTRSTPPQSGGVQERRANVNRAFRLRRRVEPADARVLLVDDVMTTGATAEACARILRSGGAAEVRVITLARAVLEKASRPI